MSTVLFAACRSVQYVPIKQSKSHRRVIDQYSTAGRCSTCLEWGLYIIYINLRIYIIQLFMSNLGILYNIRVRNIYYIYISLYIHDIYYVIYILQQVYTTIQKSSRRVAKITGVGGTRLQPVRFMGRKRCLKKKKNVRDFSRSFVVYGIFFFRYKTTSPLSQSQHLPPRARCMYVCLPTSYHLRHRCATLLVVTSLYTDKQCWAMEKYIIYYSPGNAHERLKTYFFFFYFSVAVFEQNIIIL